MPLQRVVPQFVNEKLSSHFLIRSAFSPVYVEAYSLLNGRRCDFADSLIVIASLVYRMVMMVMTILITNTRI